MSTREMNPTPLPWFVDQPTDVDLLIMSAAGNGYEIAHIELSNDEEDRANAELIVRAVNHHAALVDAISNARDLIKDYREVRSEERRFWDFERWAEAMAEAVDAIVVATGQGERRTR